MRAALIGTGQIAAEHLACLRTLPEVEVAGVCDLSRAAAEATAERFGVSRAFTDHATMLEEVRPEVVHVTTPAPSHVALAGAALRRGAHVLLEKPAALSFEDVEGLLGDARDAGRLLVEDHNYVFDPIVQRVRDLVESGGFGAVVHVEVSVCLGIGRPGSRYADANLPHFSLTRAGGPILEFLTHLASLAHAFVGPHREVRTLWRKHDTASRLPCDEFRSLVDAARGTAALSFSANTAPDAFVLAVQGTRMRARASLFEGRLSLARQRAVPRPLVPLLNDLADGVGATRAAFGTLRGKLEGGPGTYAGLWELLHRLYDAFAAGSPPPVSMHDVREVNRLVFDLLAEAPAVERAPAAEEAPAT